MKKITIVVMGLIAMCATSCAGKYEKAYSLEQCYRSCKRLQHVDALRWEMEFMKAYQAMSYSEREEYKVYRERKDVEARELDTYKKHIEEEAHKLLND